MLVRRKINMNLLNRNLLYLIIAISVFTTTPVMAQQDELLPPEQAFALSAWMEGDQLIAQYQIADGYYMYRQRFDFQVETADAKFDTAIIPDGKFKYDEFFGDMEVYRDSVRIALPIIKNAATPAVLKVKSVGQGCADIGVCYPPLQQTLMVDTASSARFIPTAYVASPDSSEQVKTDELQALLAEVTGNNMQNTASSLNVEPSSNSSALDILQSLGEEIGLADDDEIPHPDEAYILTAKLDKNNIIQSHILIADKTYLYRDKVKIKLADGSGHSVGVIVLPAGEEKYDEFLGDTEVFHDQLNVSIPIISEANASDSYSLSYQYQGCVEDRICYPPITKYLKVASDGQITIGDQLDSKANSLLTEESAIANQSSSSTTTAPTQSEQDAFASLLKDASLWSIFLFFIAGVGLTFTPCVFPMIPILSSIIAGQGDNITTRKAFSLSLVYVLSMAFTYAVAGAIVGYYGAEFNIQVWFQDPIILGIFAGIFVLLALSMFGFYDIQMPAAIQSRLTAFSNNQQGGTMAGVGLMGVFSAIIVGPCITAPLVGALIFISQTQDWQLGGLALFALGLGMGTPLLAIGTSAGKLLPRAGAWMDAVKAVFGVVLLGVAIWLLERVLPVAITMGLIAALMITSAIYMGALETQPQGVSGWRKLGKGIGIILLLYGAAYLIGAVSDSDDLIQPLRNVAGSSYNSGNNSAVIQEEHVNFRQIKGEQGLQFALNQSIEQQRFTMLDFYADWCISCKEMERYAFTHPQVVESLSTVNTLQTDVTDNDAIDTQFMSSLGIYGPPAILFFDKQGIEIRHRRVVGEMSGDDFAAHILGTF